MCGIWFYLSNEEINSLKLQCFHHYLHRRGPDEQKQLQITKYALLAFYRLAINDISHKGMQPFIFNSMDNYTYYCICNGEIYNYHELVSEYNIDHLESESDCEIILPLFLKFNKNIHELLNRLRGEFALIIIELDKTTGNLEFWIGRDPYGVRPLYFGISKNRLLFSSLLKPMSGLIERVQQYRPGYFVHYRNLNLIKEGKFYIPYIYDLSSYTLSDLYYEITERLIHAVKKRMISDRSIGALLSGGLDSSLIIAIASKILNQSIDTFSIGLKDSNATDMIYVEKVVSHLKLIHHHNVRIPSVTILDELKTIIETCETYDITTIRASSLQYFLAKYISEKTNIKVILNGDGADELMLGYLYFHFCPSEQEAASENKRLLNEIHYFDGLRVDRNLGHFGLEARLPYLDIDFVDFFLSIPMKYKMCGHGIQEKKLIRDAFHHIYPDLLPLEVLYRQKEALSDGVSSIEDSWYKKIQKRYVNEKEFYKETFQNYCDPYKNGFDKSILPHYWMPRFVENICDPSARELNL